MFCGERFESGMEMEDIHSQARKRWMDGNSRNDGKIGHHDRYLDEDEEDGESQGGNGGAADKNRPLAGHSSSIFRVSRTSGGKDRHSKVWTAKGLRDRRVRLSVSTAIQFYDLQDRLDYDKPSKAVEWLIKGAQDAINELPSLNGTFPATPKQTSDEKRPGGSETGFEPEAENEPTNYEHLQPQRLLTTISAERSTSEISKGSAPSLARSELRVKARERARERALKEKEAHQVQRRNANPPTSQSSFTELLTGGDSNNPISASQNTSPNFLHKQFRHFPSTPMDHFTLAPLAAPASKAHNPSGLSSRTHLGNPLSSVPLNVTGTGEHPALQQFSFLPDHLIPVAEVKDLCHGEDRLWYTRGCASNYGWLALIGLALFIMFSYPGMETVPWMVNSEIYPLRFRGVSGGIPAAANWTSNVIVAQSLLTLTEAIGTSWTFLIFGFISVAGLIVVLVFVPKTKGVPIEDLESGII